MSDSEHLAPDDIAGELYLHGPVHALGAELHGHLHDFGEGEHPLLEQSGEGDDLPASLVDTVAYDLVVGVVGRREEVERLVLVGLLHAQLEDVESVVDLEVTPHMSHVERIELGLRLAQCRLHLAGLEHLVGVIGAHAQRLPAIDDILAQSECEAGDALLGLLVAYGVVVERSEHATHVGIVVGAVGVSHHFLEDDRHLLLVDDIARGRHVGLGVAVVDRRVDRLDGTSQHAQHLVLVVEIRNHIGGVDACERLIVGILEE